MAVGARLVMLVIVSTAAVVAIAWLTLWAFNPAGQGRRSCALCRVRGNCAVVQAKDPDGACCCPQADADGCFTGAFSCPPGFVCWADGSATGTCHAPTSSAEDFSAWKGCRANNNDATACAARDSNDCCCVTGRGGSATSNATVCGARASPGAPDMACMHVSAEAINQDAVPMGVCQVPRTPADL